MKLLIWTTIPNHYQSAFFAALRRRGVDLRVCYYKRVPDRRIQLGWKEVSELPDGEQYVTASLQSLAEIPDWRERIHIVPGYSCHFLRSLAKHLSSVGVAWIHCSERSHSGFRWLRSYPIKRWYGSLVNRYALGALAHGSFAAKDFVRWGIREEKIAISFYSTDANDRTAAPDENCRRFGDGKTMFLFLGSLEARKGCDVLIESFAKIASEIKDTVLVLVGNDRSNGAYARRVKSLGLDDRIFFRGAVPVSQLSSVLQAADILVLPSRFDGWGVVLNEAASMGLALIGSDWAGASYHLIEPGYNGFRVKAGCIESLADAMRVYAHSPELAALHGQKSLELFPRFNSDASACKVQAAIQSWCLMKEAQEQSGNSFPVPR